MNYFLNSSSKAKKALAREGISFRDQILQEAYKDILVSQGKRHPDELTREELTELLRQLRWRFGADAHQLSRITGLSYSEVTNLLNSF